jgi:hypothetical protein
VVRVGVGVGVRVSVRCREFIIMINSKFAANLKGGAHAGKVTLRSYETKSFSVYRDLAC